MPFETLSPGMHKLLRRLSTPEKIQRYLDDLPYNKEKSGETCRSPRLVMEYNTAHCFEGAMFAYAVNTLHGHEPRLVLLEASQDSDHNLVVYRDAHGLYGCNALRLRVWEAPDLAAARALVEDYFAQLIDREARLGLAPEGERSTMNEDVAA